jgi:hypothetical protein
MLGIRPVVLCERVEPADLTPLSCMTGACQSRDDIDEGKFGVLVFLVGLISVGVSAEGWDTEQVNVAVW